MSVSLSIPTLVLTIVSVYGNDNVTSGCSSDLRQATSRASDMVKVGL